MTHHVYLLAQCRYICFCHQDGHVGPDEALIPADERTLVHFVTSLSDSFHHSSIKVYLSSMHSLHVHIPFRYSIY